MPGDMDDDGGYIRISRKGSLVLLILLNVLPLFAAISYLFAGRWLQHWLAELLEGASLPAATELFIYTAPYQWIVPALLIGAVCFMFRVRRLHWIYPFIVCVFSISSAGLMFVFALYSVFAPFLKIVEKIGG